MTDARIILRLVVGKLYGACCELCGGGTRAGVSGFEGCDGRMYVLCHYCSPRLLADTLKLLTGEVTRCRT